MRIFALLLLFMATPVLGQYQFTGEVSPQNVGKTVYLSLVEDYRKSSRIYLEQIVRKAKVDSLGHFQFEGNNLLDQNRIYRIHLDACSEESEAHHFLGQCNSSKSVLFIANNRDTVHFPTSFEDQPLCTITSTNPKSDALLEIELMKEEMVFDFTDFWSETNRKLNSRKWFSTFQSFGEELGEPLAELYIYDFLSDRGSETYAYYLQDVADNGYYDNLLQRLQNTYANAHFTQQFEAEIATDKQLGSFHTPSWNWTWTLLILLLLSLGFNLYLFVRKKSRGKVPSQEILQKLTPQEQKIVSQILLDKSNKEIASELFVSHSTIKTHINNLYKKLEVSTRQDIVSLFKK